DLTVTGVQTCALPIYRVYSDGLTLESKMPSAERLDIRRYQLRFAGSVWQRWHTRINQQKIYYEGFAENSFNLGPTEYSPLKDGQIGRASCRERVEMWV